MILSVACEWPRSGPELTFGFWSGCQASVTPYSAILAFKNLATSASVVLPGTIVAYASSWKSEANCAAFLRISTSSGSLMESHSYTSSSEETSLFLSLPIKAINSSCWLWVSPSAISLLAEELIATVGNPFSLMKATALATADSPLGIRSTFSWMAMSSSALASPSGEKARE